MSVNQLTENDSQFLSILRSLSIFVIVFGHVGGFWVFRPYSEYLHVFVAVFFFISGVLSLNSFNRAPSIKAYYVKRLSVLLIPYYLLCVLSLIVYVCVNGHFPMFDIGHIMKWIQIRPSNALMPYPIGQIWFLHTLTIITFMSPLYFFALKKKQSNLFVIIFPLILLSALQLFFEVDQLFYFMGNNFFKPLVHSTFYIFGIIYFSSAEIRKIRHVILLFACSLFLTVFLVMLTNIDIDLSFHTVVPDIYYVAVSFLAIFILLIFKNMIVKVVNCNKYIGNAFDFLHRHTFSIFLLHTFGIYLSETVLGLVEPSEKTIVYGITKLIAVLMITCVLVVPFTKLSNFIISIFSRVGLGEKMSTQVS